VEYTDADKLRIAQEVIDKTKKSAHYDTGRLYRSLYRYLSRGNIIFKEMFYGMYNDNSDLVQNAITMMPREIQWQVILIGEDGQPYTGTLKTKSGKILRSTNIGTHTGASRNIKKFLNALAKNGKETKDSTGKTSGRDNKKAT